MGITHHVRDVDAAHARAMAAGAKPVLPPTDVFWCDRFGPVVDPFGHRWSLASRKAILTRRQMQEGMEAWIAARCAAQGEPQG